MFRLMLISLLTGSLAGCLAIAFFFGIESLRFVFLHHWAGLTLPAPSGEELFSGPPGPFRPWIIPILTTSVGLATGLLVKWFIPDSGKNCTDGTDAMTKAFHHQEGKIPPLVPLIRGCTAILTIASGGSAGREGPITQIGAGLGSWLADKLKLSVQERRILLLAGAGGGLGAIFRAPLGGAITAVEIIYKEDFESEALLPAVISSVISYTIFTLAYGQQPMFAIPHFHFTNPRELICYATLGLFCALSGWFYVRTFFTIKYKFFKPLQNKIGIPLTMALGGLLMGVLGMQFPQLLSGGYGWLELAILGKLSLTMMLGVLIGKTIATSLTLGSGMSGGMFAPALFVGGMSGGLIGQLGHRYFPNIVLHPGGYVLVGMAAFFAGAGSAPVGPLIMVCELTQDYGLLAPLMLASALCIFINRRFSLYENQLDNKFQSPAHAGELFVDILQAHQVQELMSELRTVHTVHEDLKFSEFKKLFANTKQHYFPVVDKNNRLTGIFSTTDFRGVLFEPDIEELVVVKDIATTDIIYTTPSEDLNKVLKKFTQKNLDALPVVLDKDPAHLLGMLRRREVIAFYNEQLNRIKASNRSDHPRGL